MKIHLSLDGADFKAQVKRLRDQLNRCLNNGRLDDDFEGQLARLSQFEAELLRELLPYYRVYASQIKPTSMAIERLEQVGAFRFERFLQSALRVSQNCFITSSVDGQVQFFQLHLAADSSQHEKLEVEWGPPLETIQEPILQLANVDDGTVLLFGMDGGCYRLAGDDAEQVPEGNGRMDVEQSELDHPLYEFGKALALNEESIVPNWTAWGRIREHDFVVGTNHGELKLLDLHRREKIIKTKLERLQGNLFDVQSTRGTAVILSEDGIIYLLEENFGDWYLNEEATIEAAFFTNLLQLDTSNYLLMDVEGEFNLLALDRLDTPTELWHLPLYP